MAKPKPKPTDDHTWSWSLDPHGMICFPSPESYQTVTKLWETTELTAFHDAELAKARQIAAGVMSSAPQDANALFATILVNGLRADYDGLVDKHYLTSLSSVKNSRIIAEKLLAIDPSCYDAHLAVGVENFMLSLKPAPLRLFLRLTGAETDRELGLQRLRLTAEKGHYLKPYAQLLLAVAALRSQDRDQARSILRELAVQFPHNRLYVEELARLR